MDLVDQRTAIEQRQESIRSMKQLKDRNLIIAGLGGVGAWVALYAALLGVKEMYIFDDDVIEASNLNRTPFRIEDVGKQKVLAVQELIAERRPDVIALPFNEKFTTNTFESIWGVDSFIDCTDTSRLKDDLYAFVREPDYLKTAQSKGKYVFNRYYKLGYDRESITFATELKSGMFGEDNSYSETPSYLVPPALLACFVISDILHHNPLNHPSLTVRASKILQLVEEAQEIRREKGADIYG